MNRLSPKNILLSLLLFVIAGFLEIGGGYLVWLSLKYDFSWMLGALGGFVLFLYGVVPTFQIRYPPPISKNPATTNRNKEVRIFFGDNLFIVIL